MHTIQHARGAGAAGPENGEGVAAGTAHALWDQASSNGIDSGGASAAAQASELIAGEAEARAYLRNVAAGLSRPGDLLLLLSEVEGHKRKGAARAIENALEAGA